MQKTISNYFFCFFVFIKKMKSQGQRDCGCGNCPSLKNSYNVCTSYEQELVAFNGGFIPAPPNSDVENIDGRFKLSFAPDLSYATFQVFVFNATNPGNQIVAAHLHVGDANANGPVIVTLFNNPEGTNVDGLLSNGKITNADIAHIEGYNTVASLYQGIQRGNIYVNIHSQLLPAGILRAQLFKTQ